MFGSTAAALLLATAGITGFAVLKRDGSNSEWLPTFNSPEDRPMITLPLSVRGPLVREGHCLYANFPTKQRVLLAFPPYARFDEATNTLIMDPDRYQVGSETYGIEGAGVLPEDKFGGWRVKPDASCDTSQIFVVLVSQKQALP